MTDPSIRLVIHTSSDTVPKDPCTVRGHRWAWCQRTDGAEIQRCYDCGKVRR